MPVPAGVNFPAVPVIQVAMTGTAPALQPVASLRSINGNLVDYNATLEVVNTSGQSVNVTLIDPGRTPAGNPGDQAPIAVPNGATMRIDLLRAHVDRDSNTITVAFDPVPGVAAEVIY